jgi:hypothetical protein
MSFQISDGTFHSSSDKVYLRGNFNGWGTTDEMIDQTGLGIYTRTISMNQSSTFEYKYFINSAGAANGGWEENIGLGENGNRTFQTEISDMELTVDIFNHESVTLSVLSPNGFENWQVGTTHSVQWISNGVQLVKIEYSVDNGISWNLIANNLSSGTGNYTWTIPYNVSSNCKIKISDETVVGFSDESDHSFSISGLSDVIDFSKIEAKYNVLKFHQLVWGNPSFSSFNYSFQVITPEEFNTQKPLDVLPFDAGYVAADGSIFVCDPTTPEQKAVFTDIDKAALYYFCQAYLQFYYQTSEIPLLLKVGFAAFESHIDPDDAIIKTAVNAYGPPFSSFSVFNNRENFIAKNGFAVAYAFGEFMNIFKNWGYPNITEISKTGFNVYSWWFNVNSLEGLLGDFNRYVEARFLETNEQMRVQLYKETENFKFYTRGIDGINYPSFSNTLEAAYLEYSTNFNVKAWEKLTFFSLPECIDAELEGSACGGRLTGGTAWSSGLHSTCAYTSDQVPVFHGMNRHELAHAIQGIMPQGSVTAWLNEGFPSLLSEMPITEQFINSTKNNAVEGLQIATQLYGHRPTYDETKIYPSDPYYDYYTLGMLMNYYIFQKGGYQALKDVQMGDLNGFQKLGYTTCQSFLDDFYFYFDVRIQNIPIVQLLSPNTGSEIPSSVVGLQWQTLKPEAKLNVFVSTDGGNLWTKIASETTLTTCSWNSESYAGEFYLKFEAPNSLNIGNTYGPFRKVNINALQLTYPDGNELFISTDTIRIQWGTTNIPNINIDFSDDNGENWTRIGSNISTSSGSINWQVGDVSSDRCKIRITNSADNNVSDASNKPFKIVRTNPIGGPYLADENTVALLHFDNSYENISNPSFNGFANNTVSFEPSFNENLISCMKIDNTSPSVMSNIEIPFYNQLTLSNNWTIEFWFKISSWGSGTVEFPFMFIKTGANYFIFLNPSTKTLRAGYDYEGGAEQVFLPENSLALNKWYHVVFIRNKANTTLKCLLHDSNRQLVASALVKYTASHLPRTNTDPVRLGGFSWGSNCQFDGYADELRISNIAREFRSLSITAPNGGENLTAGSITNITWASSDIDKLKLEYSTDNGSSWTTIVSNISASTGSYSWTIPSTASTNCKVKISDQSDLTFSDTSEQTFIISKAVSLALTKPAGGESWQTSSIQNITWNSEGITTLKLEYSTDLGSTWNVINNSVPASNHSFAFTIPNVVAYEWKIRISDISNAATSDISDGRFVTFNEIPSNVPPLLSIEYTVFTWPLNARYPVTTPADDEIINGRVGNACGPTAMANLIRYWEFPLKGKGSRTFVDREELIWYADFENTIYNYDRMPASVPQNAAPEVYDAVATMMYHAGVGMFDPFRSGAQDGLINALINNFNYSPKAKFIYRNDYTPEQWDKVFKSEFAQGRPIIIGGDGGPLPEGGVAGHWFICDGYNIANQYHIRWDYGEKNDAYLPLYEFKPYHVNNWALVYLEPDLKGKQIELTTPSGYESWQQGTQKTINWESTNITSLNIEFSTNNGFDWTTLASNIPAASGSYNLTIPAGASKECKIRISDASDMNIYSRNKVPFSVFDTKELAIIPSFPQNLQSGTHFPIRWNSKGIDEVSIDYSIDNGVNWITISDTIAALEVYIWGVPDISSSTCMIRLTDKSDKTTNTSSQLFSIGSNQYVGGPYALDNNVVALLHFNNNFDNEANQTFRGISNQIVTFEENFELGSDMGVLIDNPDTTVYSNVEVPFYNALSLTKDWTIELWFKISSWGTGTVTYPTLVAKNGMNYYIAPDPVSKTLRAGYSHSAGGEQISLPANSIQENKWYHIAFIRNTSTTSLSLQLHDKNRVLLSSVSSKYNSPNTPKISTDPLVIGGYHVISKSQFDGYIDELRISKVAREFRSLVLTSPVGGESYIAGNSVSVTWSSKDILKVKLEYSSNNGSTWNTIASNFDASTGSYSWNVPNVASTTYKIRISDQNDASFFDISNQPFSILKVSSLTLTTPNGGENWNVGSSENITWVAESITLIKLAYTTDGGTSWITIAENVNASTGSYTWYIPDVTSNNCKIRISNQNDAILFDLSDQDFTIKKGNGISNFNSIKYELYPNRPNPFSSSTEIGFYLPENQFVSIVIYDIYGRVVKNITSQEQTAGEHFYIWEPCNLNAGIYLCRMQTRGYIKTRKLIMQERE